MRSAIEKSIYYTDVNNFNSVITFNYTDEKSFKNIIKDLSNNIETVATFGCKTNNICYKIFDELFYLYKELLFDKTTSIYLINRKGLSVCLFRQTNTLKTETLNNVNILNNVNNVNNVNTLNNVNNVNTLNNVNNVNTLETDILESLKTLENQKIAVIKIDSVLSEFLPTSYKPYFFYPLVFGVGFIISWKYFSQD